MQRSGSNTNLNSNYTNSAGTVWEMAMVVALVLAQMENDVQISLC
ncbi:hypothetical protein DOY81_011549 [Sarcophaga bullata]|nr:hypothetical protein DOY81_011549 [Sarcophaga bullata]